MKKILLAVIIILIFTGISGYFVRNRVQNRVKELFRLNESLQEEGFYMADFEFKMMGFVYYLDRGDYKKALTGLKRYHKQLKNKENLIRIPEFKSVEAEFDFYLNLQNPKTGAFMDESFPYCTFNEPTENVIAHLDLLANKTGRTLRLKYPLKYLDEISTPEKMLAFLDDVSHVGLAGSKMPQTTYVFGRSLLSYLNDESAIAGNNLYNFSSECRTALLKWFYNDQDSITGFWGPRSRKTNQPVKLDLTNTASIIKAFVDSQGNDIYKDFPLRFSSRMITSTLQVLTGPVPADDEPDELHEWNLSMGKGIYMLLRYLWEDATAEQREKAKSVIENYVKIRFEKYYIPEEGAFSYYPGADHASLDGTGGSVLKEIGAFSPVRQKRLWGSPEENIKDLGIFTGIKKEDIGLISGMKGINSVRLYRTKPDYGNLTKNVYAVAYPAETCVLDIVELVPEINEWLNRQPLSLGNWTSAEEIRKDFASTGIEAPLVFKGAFPDELIKKLFSEDHELSVIGFDILQIPRCRITWMADSGK